MQYDSIILELMSRIKKLEDQVANLTQQMEMMREKPASSSVEQVEKSQSYTKTTDAMMDACYAFGKQAFQNRTGYLWPMADQVAAQTGMNRNSAFMYIGVVKNMLEGVVYKRTVNGKALERYLSNILSEYGKNGLSRALHATELHIAYRKQCGIPTESVEALCATYRKKL